MLNFKQEGEQMSLHTSNNGDGKEFDSAKTQAANAMKQSFQKAEGQPGQTPNDNTQRWSWNDLAGLSTARLNASPSGASLATIEKTIRETWANLAPTIDLDIIAVDKNTTPGIYVSTLIITARYANDPNSPVAYHSLILENSIEPLLPRRINLRGEQVEVLQVVGDAYDLPMAEILHSIVVEKFPKASHHLNGYAEVIVRDFDMTDPQHIMNLTVNAVKACRERLDEINSEALDLDLAYAEQDAQLTELVSYGRSVKFDPTEMPIRSDIELQLVSTPLESNQMFGTQQTVLANVYGFMDILWDSQVDTQNQFTQNWGQQTGPHPVYRANFVITQMENYRYQSLETSLVNFIMAYYLSENAHWVRTLKPVRKGKEDLMHDIGNIGYDISIKNDGSYGKINTTPDVFTDQHLYQFVGAYFHPGIVFSLDIPECGAMTWQYRTFARAAVGSAEARDEIMQAAQTLTHGRFEKYYKGTGNPIISNDNIIYLGHYPAKDGIRDIRDLDYLAVCGTVGANDRSAIDTWIGTYNGSQDIEKRLAVRRQYINDICGGATIYGKALRVNIEDAFLEALVLGCLDWNFRINPQVPYADNYDYRRPNANYVANAVVNSQNSGIFRGGFFNNGPRNSGYGGGFSTIR